MARITGFVNAAAVGIGCIALSVPTAVSAPTTAGYALAVRDATTPMPDPDSFTSSELNSWLAVQEQLPDFEAHLRSNLKGFAGLYRDARGTVVVAVAGNLSEQIDAIVGYPLSGATVTVTPASWTTAELQAVVDAISSDIKSGELFGVPVNWVGVDVVNNDVELNVTSVSDDFVKRVVVYGPMVRVSQGPPSLQASCTGRGNCANPLKGGIDITGPQNCTSGFVGYSGTAYYLLTAGHCGALNSTWREDNGITIGSVKRRTYVNNAHADAEAIVITGSQKGNKLYYGSTAAFFNVDGLHGATYVGDAVCLSARSMQSYNCGTISHVNVTLCYSDGVCVLGTNMTINTNGIGGDSGGPMFTPEGGQQIKATGIFAAVNANSDNWYSTIDWVGYHTNVTPCQMSSC